MQKLHIISLGCSKNLVDSQVMLGRLRDYELTQDLSEADVIIINTCGFLQAAKEESLGHIFEALESRKSGALLVASGCLVARYEKELRELIPEIDILTGVGDFDKIDSMIATKKSISSDKVYLSEDSRLITDSNVHTYIKISEGCNQTCSFCAIPSFKGKLQSRSIDSILKEIESLARLGYQDFSFIAQDSSSYLLDKGIKDGLIKLINAVHAQGIVRSARILYLYPSSTSFALLDSIAKSDIFASYFDMPLQHISTSVLSHMQRSSKDVKALLSHMKQVPNAFIRSSIIVGYPTESDADFSELCKFVEDYRFDRLNIFEYSSEEGTKAGSLEVLPKPVITKRIKTLNKILSKQQKALYKSMVNKKYEAIIEGKSEVSEYFYSARLKAWAPEIDGEILINDGDIKGAGYYEVEVLESKDGILVGKALSAL
ncbi:30S ribosomal protein S12 methylthiotransferase RimO [Helicobacter sp. 11S02629-2]|uniref:30S ribosomal protein S12 methylthiotransferase RimO n=1 Tax=Helicobacter sp. 11S02629-2 TaxID=1476195 RepID=UPI000BA592DA|nr:30S ribosomal protein S12 methylthiotransferase RimO [Helicobacter sp. 11S02629-2]PAF45686.1 ribosomal protein S12 methylthiotransferase RimO [Helicobacter sp. 11S02629-2]